MHEAAARGYERKHSTYAASRPTYHEAILDLIVAVLPTGPVVDLGAGTGISTAALVDRGCDVIAVEPVDGMRDQLRATVVDATVLEGTAESVPLGDGSAGAVVVAQAFHWFDHAPALDEIARVLHDEGLLITLWNVRDESVPWMAAYTEIQDRVQGDTPRYRDMTWRHAIASDHRFTLIDEASIANPQPSSVEHTVGRFLSTSFIAQLDEQRQNAMVAELRELLVDLGPTFDFPYVTEAQIWGRASADG